MNALGRSGQLARSVFYRVVWRRSVRTLGRINVAVEPHNRISIAIEQLEVALNVWFSRQDYFAVITLAGAAEEILGKALEAHGQQNALLSLQDAFVALYRNREGESPDPKWLFRRANHARNQSKHFDLGASEFITIDVQEEARNLLDRSITNYWRLRTDETAPMRRFLEEQRGAP